MTGVLGFSFCSFLRGYLFRWVFSAWVVSLGFVSASSFCYICDLFIVRWVFWLCFWVCFLIVCFGFVLIASSPLILRGPFADFSFVYFPVLIG